MRAVVQRSGAASVTVGEEIVGAIPHGIVVLLGVEKGDTPHDVAFMVDKILTLRIFDDTVGKMNLSVEDVEGHLLVVSQFTLLGDARRGRRPSFVDAAPPEIGNALYEAFIEGVKLRGRGVATGRFGADMQVALINDGPVTILLDSRKLF